MLTKYDIEHWRIDGDGNLVLVVTTEAEWFTGAPSPDFADLTDSRLYPANTKADGSGTAINWKGYTPQVVPTLANNHKFFPYDNKGRTPEVVTITQFMLPETVVVPFLYQVVNSDGVVLEETMLDLVAGIVGVQEDPEDFTMTPKIGWVVRTLKEKPNVPFTLSHGLNP